MSEQSGRVLRDVFISYSHVDRTVANAICVRLEQAGMRCWIAPRDVSAGGYWAEAILSAIAQSRAFVFVFSDVSQRSHQVMRELERAVHHGRPILPFRIEDVRPAGAVEYFISGCHWLDALTPPLERHIDALVRSVGHLVQQRTDGAPAEAAALTSPDPVAETAEPPGPTSVDPGELEGVIIGDFRLGLFLGSGGAGVVHEAWDMKRRTRCCAKVYFPLPAEMGAQRATANVFAALSQMAHPAVIRPIGLEPWIWRGLDTHVLVTELIDGEPLDVWFASPAARRWPDRLRLMAQIVEGVDAVARCRFVGDFGIEHVGLPHGDLKASNIILRSDGSPVIVDFLDFRSEQVIEYVRRKRSIAERLGNIRLPTFRAPAPQIDAISAIIGTPGRMAPEQQFHGVATAATDTYTLGRLFEDFADIPSDEADGRRDDIAREVGTMIAVMMSEDPKARPSDLRPIRDRLLQLAGDRQPRLWRALRGILRR